MAFPLGEDGNEHVGAGNLVPPRRLHVDHGALDDALESRSRLGILVVASHEVLEVGIDVVDEHAAQLVEIDVAGPHDGSRLRVIGQRKKEMLQRRVFVMSLIGVGQRLVQRLFETRCKCRHYDLTFSPSRIAADAGSDGRNP